MNYILISILSIAVILLSVRLAILEDKFRDLTKYLGAQELFED